MPIIYLVRRETVPVYVGFTSRNIQIRWKEHCENALMGSNCPFHKAIRDYGTKAFTIEEVYSNENPEHTLNTMEPQFIREYNTHLTQGGYNATWGGGSLVRKGESEEFIGPMPNLKVKFPKKYLEIEARVRREMARNLHTA